MGLVAAGLIVGYVTESDKVVDKAVGCWRVAGAEV